MNISIYDMLINKPPLATVTSRLNANPNSHMNDDNGGSAWAPRVLQQWRRDVCSTIMEEGNLRGRREPARSASIGAKHNNGDDVAPREEDTLTMRDSVFNPNKAYCLGWF